MSAPDPSVFVQPRVRPEIQVGNRAEVMPDIGPESKPLDIRKHVAGNISVCRRRAGMSQSDVGRLLGLEKETICRIENAKISVTVDRLQEFAVIFQCSLHDFLINDQNESHDLGGDKARGALA